MAGENSLRRIVAAMGFGLICGLIYGTAGSVLADDHGKVRIYKLNKKQQLLRQRRMEKSGVAGCHGLSRPGQVHRFAQSGYAYCALFAENNCRQGTEITAKWHGKKYRSANVDLTRPQVRLLPGSQWILAPYRNTAIQSWFCRY